MQAAHSKGELVPLGTPHPPGPLGAVDAVFPLLQEAAQLAGSPPEALGYLQLVLVRPQPVVTHCRSLGRARLAGARQTGATRGPSWAGEESFSRVMSLLRL